MNLYRKLRGRPPLNRRRKIFAFSIENYSNAGANLRFCHDDIEGLKQALDVRSGYVLERWLKDSAATCSAIVDLLRDAVSRANAGDRVRVFGSSHGAQIRGGVERDRKEEGIVAWGMDLVLDNTVNAILSEAVPGADLIVCLDLCHSGGMDRKMRSASGELTIRSVVPEMVEGVGMASWRSSKARALSGGGCLITACGEQETAAEDPRISGGAFSTCLSRVLMKAEPADSAGMVLVATAAALRNAGYEQNPQIFGNKALPFIGDV